MSQLMWKNYSMQEEAKTIEPVLCGHCGNHNRMKVLGSIFDTQEHETENGSAFEAGTMYQVCRCPSCNKPVLAGGSWHQHQEYSEWRPELLLPNQQHLNAISARQQQSADKRFMELAIEEARKARQEEGKIRPSPKVGAVVARGIDWVTSGYRGQYKDGDHAEYTVLECRCKDEVLVGATVYTTLEPCTTRNHPKIPCVQRLISRKVARVVIGMLDPDERVRGRGVLTLRKANIQVDLFPPELMAQLEELNRDFIADRERPSIAAHNATGHPPSTDATTAAHVVSSIVKPRQTEAGSALDFIGATPLMGAGSLGRPSTKAK